MAPEKISRRISRWTKALMPGVFPYLKQAYWWLRKSLPMFDFQLDSPDRRVLEADILPYFANQPSICTVLFVGCDWYTKPYKKYFSKQQYWTIDPDPTRKKYGAKLHVIDVLENLDRHFPENSFDLIVCNGVFGHGLNQPNQIEQAIDQCFRHLQQHGQFILGWNDLPQHVPMPLEECQALKQFQPKIFPPLQTSQIDTQTPNRHFYNFYTKTS